MLVNYLIFPYDNVGIAVSTYLNKKPPHQSVMDWTPQSQDLNNIDTVWDYLDREWNKKAANNQRRALGVLQEACRTILQDYLKKFQESFLREFRLCQRINMVIRSNSVFCFHLCLHVSINCCTEHKEMRK